MSIFKIFLMLGLMFYTFITMVGGNPRGDPYGFRYWEDPACASLFYRCIELTTIGIIRRVPRPRRHWPLLWIRGVHDSSILHVR